MRIKSIKINNLRVIETLSLEAHPHANVITGRNGAGKTTVLESIVVLAKGRSFRGGQVSSLIGPAGDLFRVVMDIETDHGDASRVGIQRDSQHFQARRDGKDVQQLSDLATSLPHVLLEPNSHLLVSGPPEGRRRYLDWGVFHTEPMYLALWRRYMRVLKQRNAALRSGEMTVAESMEPMLAETGRDVDLARRQMVEAVAARLRDHVAPLAPQLSAVTMEYRSGWRGEDLRVALEQGRAGDRERGTTHAGPHRADFVLRSEGEAIRDRFSRGEQKILAAALLLAQAETLAAEGERPVLLLDDIASELDPPHLARILDVILAMGAQTWVTGVDAPRALLERLGQHARFHVKQGAIAGP